MSVEAIVAVGGFVLASIGGSVAFVQMFIRLGGLVKDLQHGQTDHDRAIAELKHDQKNDRTRISSLETLRTADVERIVKIETNFINVKDSLDRIERDQKENFDTLAESIREIRIVAPKP